MLIKYLGGRSRLKISLNRRPYYFGPENDRTVDIKDQGVINHIFSQPNRSEFQVIEKEPELPVQAEEIKEPVEEKVQEPVEKKVIVKKKKRKKGVR